MGSDDFALDIRNVTKTFPGVTALSEVSLQVLPGEVHALVGENGAGKSTLMAVAAGALAPDPQSGDVRIAGTALGGVHPTRARELGLSIVFQHPALLPDLTVTENFLLGVQREHRPKVADGTEWTKRQLEANGAGLIDPRARVETLNSGQRQLVEIARAVAGKPSVLILDEPTEALTLNDIEVLFENIKRLTDAGTAIVYISHRIPDVKQIADRVTLLRDGQTRGTYDVNDISEDDIVRLIVGRSIEAAFPEKADDVSGALLEVSGMSGEGFNDIDMHVSAGEIVGFAGIEGNGQADFIRALAGLESATATTCQIKGRDHSLGSVRKAQEDGIVYMPGDKIQEGLFLQEPVRVNASVLALQHVSTGGVIRTSREAETFRPALAALAVKTPSIETRIGSLSGGNQQKVVLARALSAKPEVLLVEEPTQGVDAGVRVEMYQNLRDVASSGNGVVVLSSDAFELAGLCDRVLIFSRGQIIRELVGPEVTEDRITQAVLTSTAIRSGASERSSGRVRQFLSGDLGPTSVLLLAIVAVVAYTAVRNPLFTGQQNMISTLFLAATLILVSHGQLAVIMTGGIDLSVGPLIGACTVVSSFLLIDGASPGRMLLGFLALVGVAITVGLANAFLIRAGKLSPIIATLVTFTLLQGVGLLMRSTPGGSFSIPLTDALNRTLGGIPILFIIVVVLSVVLEFVLRRTMLGIRLRGVGSDEVISQKLGTNINLTIAAAYVICSLFAAVASLLVISSIGLGDSASGASFTFASVTAVILAGAAISGGRGSVVATMLGALLIQASLSATTFLNLEQYWQSYLTGALMLCAAAVLAKIRWRA